MYTQQRFKGVKKGVVRASVLVAFTLLVGGIVFISSDSQSLFKTAVVFGQGEGEGDGSGGSTGGSSGGSTGGSSGGSTGGSSSVDIDSFEINLDICDDSCKGGSGSDPIITPDCSTDPHLCDTTCYTYYNDHSPGCAPGQTGSVLYRIPHDSCTGLQNGDWVVEYNTCTTPTSDPACTPSPLRESRTDGCGVGMTGSITHARSGDTCNGWGDWSVVSNTCIPTTITPTCTDVPAYTSYPCNAGETGTGRTWESWGNTCSPGVWSDWTLIRNECTPTAPTCTPVSTRTSYPCNAGETGTGRTWESWANTCSPGVWSDWDLVSEDCRLTCTPTDTSYTNTTSCPAGQFGTGITRYYERNSCDGITGSREVSRDCTPLPTVDLGATSFLVKSGENVGLYWNIRAAFDMNCTVTGRGLSHSITHKAGVDTIVPATDPYTGPMTRITNTQIYTLTCTAPSHPAMPDQIDTVRVESGTINQDI